MEFEVRHVGGIENCFVSLPLHLIQTLESTRPGGFIPQVLTLQLRSPTTNHQWVVAWSGGTSSSSAIEVAGQFADCISLPDHTNVQVKAAPNVTSATLVTIEPSSEDDWEVLELNAEQAEAAMLQQVRIVQETMRFPLWLHGHTIITFLVVSTFPKNAVVQLVPGTEVAVAPKRRKTDLKKQDALVQSSNKGLNIAKALLRLQDSDKRLIHKSEVKGIELDVALTSVAHIHPETAKQFSLDSLQLVTIVPRLSSKEPTRTPDSDILRSRSSSNLKEPNKDVPSDKKRSCQAVVHILLSESVAKGHLMIARSLRLYLRASLHSWVYLKIFTANSREDTAPLSLSPCYFKMLGQDKAIEKNGLEVIDRHRVQKPGSESTGTYMGTVDWTIPERFAASFSNNFPSEEDQDTSIQSGIKKGLRGLLQAWFLAQFNAIASAAGSEINSLIFGKETIIHFEVKGLDIETDRNVEEPASSNSYALLQNRKGTAGASLECFFLLTINEESVHDSDVNSYKLAFDERVKENLGELELFRKLKFGDPVSLYAYKEKSSGKNFTGNLISLSWMETAATDIIGRMMALLSPASGMLFSTYNFPIPGHVLICGPHGSGKTVLAKAVAKSLEESEDLLAHVVFVGCSGLALEKASTMRQTISSCISEALDHAPSLVIFDDLDSIISSSSDSEGSQPSTSVVALTKFLTDVMDEYGEKRKSSCGIGPIAFLACVQALENIPKSLSSSGRFDFHVQLPAPAASERQAILRHEIKRRSLQCSDDILLDVASKCDGYDAYDLEILVDRTVHAAIGRFLPSNYSSGEHASPTLVRDDFSRAMHEFLPVAMRDITRSAPEGGRSGWDDVGGLQDIRNAIKEMIELPSKFPNIFAKAPLRLRSNVLLYGPPGCGKTHIVGAAAAACSLRFISVKGPELLNKYIGASEQAVRDIFSKAAAAAPCLLFFDEFDSIAPKRGHDNTGVTDRVVNQFLTELDGVEVLTGVFVFAATSRPDLLDAALLRPGRLDRMLFCDFPSPKERLDILSVLSGKLPLANDVDLDAIAYMTEGFSGADLQALLSDAQLAAVHEHLSSESREIGRMPVISDALLKSVASKARPSISESEKQRLYSIYSQFLDSKKSAAAQSRDAKGKRATLA